MVNIIKKERKKKGKNGRPQLREKDIEKALRATGGFISRAAKMLDVTQGCISIRIQRSEYLQQVRDEVENEWLDIAEDELLKKIRAGDLVAILFFLKCKGKKRGYIEKQVIQTEISLNHDDWVITAKESYDKTIKQIPA